MAAIAIAIGAAIAPNATPTPAIKVPMTVKIGASAMNAATINPITATTTAIVAAND